MFRYVLQKVQQRIPYVMRLENLMGLQTILWSLWTLAVGATAYYDWHRAALAHQPVNITGLVIDSIFVGLVGLLVMTIIEMRIEPWRFRD